MKRLILALAILGILVGCASWFRRPLVLTVYAQTLPIHRTLIWDAPMVDATHGAATSYLVTQDAVQIGVPTVASQVVTFTTLGTHTLTVAGVNPFGTGPTASLTVNVVVPGAAQHLRLQ